jgi:hypothetical protein
MNSLSTTTMSFQNLSTAMSTGYHPGKREVDKQKKKE